MRFRVLAVFDCRPCDSIDLLSAALLAASGEVSSWMIAALYLHSSSILCCVMTIHTSDLRTNLTYFLGPDGSDGAFAVRGVGSLRCAIIVEELSTKFPLGREERLMREVLAGLGCGRDKSTMED